MAHLQLLFKIVVHLELSNHNILPIQSLRIGPGYYIPESSNHSLYLIKLDTVAAILREISEGTSY